MSDETVERVLTVAETMEQLKLSRATISRLMNREGFPPARHITGNRIGFIASEINSWLLSRPLKISKES
jgi:predicted DNA-binding transcriptional regulator AlpA